ncbi:TetR/AcrR family transcriptional regulator [Paenibacillus glycanilyticus]|uniref:TetR/AcrR family transcriptional regulator n=1 Tax=Paenibacillus glycanilyticus TaxID=126569 RepID=UPI00203FB1BF|nr:TetR/AcrR family transcriptional regulator [Paenibacillus glycanilyticus]MCM3626187.1 TetR/AcrR family transcriptional regulator [Paenibacillus glycanilyticus]
MANKSKKEHILKIASGLFNKQGIRATGVDQVVSESQIAKMTLYNHFQSKDELVLAYLRGQDEQWRKWFESSVNKQGTNPSEKLLAIYDVLGEWFEDPDFNGCTYIKTASEFLDRSHIYFEAAHHYKMFMREFIASLVEELETSNREALTNRLFLLVEGAITTRMMQTDLESARHARETAEVILEKFIQNKRQPT